MPKRDMDVVRAILLQIEDLGPVAGAGGYAASGLADDMVTNDWTSEMVQHHIRLLVDAGFVDEFRPGIIRGLTWAGCEFIESVRDPETWLKVKEGASKMKGWSADLLMDMAKAYVKQKASELIGLPL